MIFGLGIDMIEVERVREKIDKEQGFRELVFTPGEVAYCNSMTNRYEHYAARFAAKEAFLKALGTGWVKGTAFNEIEILHGDNSKPILSLSGKTAVTVEQLRLGNISVSLTHLKTIASAVVIIENR